MESVGATCGGSTKDDRSSTTTSLNHIRSENSDKTINQTTTALTSTLSPSISSVASSAASSPVATSAATDTLSIGSISNNSSHISIPLQRNPIGANPRDINNPLSINQLTKRPRDESNGVSSNSSGSSINSNTCTSLASHAVPGSIRPYYNHSKCGFQSHTRHTSSHASSNTTTTPTS